MDIRNTKSGKTVIAHLSGQFTYSDDKKFMNAARELALDQPLTLAIDVSDLRHAGVVSRHLRHVCVVRPHLPHFVPQPIRLVPAHAAIVAGVRWKWKSQLRPTSTRPSGPDCQTLCGF